MGYRWRCLTCKEKDIVKVYEGETGRSARIRGTEHVKDFEKKKEKSVLFKHKLTDHKDETVKFKMEITKKFKDSLTRQANEAVRIFGRPSTESLNSKSEFNHPPLARVVVEKKKPFLRFGKTTNQTSDIISNNFIHVQKSQSKSEEMANSSEQQQ